MNGIPDSEWLASMVVAAYSEKRYDLGEALARLCGQAHRMEHRAAAEAPDPRNEPVHVQELVLAHERGDDGQDPAVAWCQYEGCGMAIRWSGPYQWEHINAAGRWVTSPLPAHLGVPPAAVSESDEPAPGEAATLVTPSARCVATVGGEECHGVLYWEVNNGTPGWVHLDPGENHHIPIANVPKPVTR